MGRQEFSWTENGLDAAKAERGSNLSRDGLANIDREPMFCFEVGGCALLASSARNLCAHRQIKCDRPAASRVNVAWQGGQAQHVGRP